ncbi:MAG: nicotinate-nucleotide--dimethylbenzimidazole phosphoribosyltransferase [Clostridiales bacterium]|nr:nicotinate-nucleotide--dimethylbenzimidazole phosphoribosyltransferase [Clostridiales bacterium]
MENIFCKYIDEIKGPDASAMQAALNRQESLAKPPHSLGKLEDISVKFAGITGKVFNSADKRRVIVFSADNGICEEGVASAPQSVTLAQTINFTRGLTGVAVIAKHFNTDLDVIDMGILSDFSCPGVRNEKIAHGTKNFSKEPAMTREECVRAMMTGVNAALRARDEGIEIFGVGEMGIGNTSTSSAVLSVILNLPAEDTVSRGGGINDASYIRKKTLIDSAIALHRPDPADPIDVIAKVGGFDIAAMCGAYIGAAWARMPVVVDGFISAVAALCAYRLNPLCAHFMIPSHASREKGYMLAMNEMGLAPMLNMDMRLGEGSGCPIAFEIVSCALSVIKNMATFEEAAIDDGYLQEIRENKAFQGEA